MGDGLNVQGRRCGRLTAALNLSRWPAVKVTSLTFDRVNGPTVRGASSPVTVTASTTGVIDPADGWHAYAVLVPRGTGAVTVIATGPDGKQIDRRQLAVGDNASTPVSSTTAAAHSSAVPISPTTALTTTARWPVSCGSRLPPPLAGVSATVVPQAAGGWRFRVANGTARNLTINPMFGYVQVVTDEHGRVEVVSSDQSYVLMKASVVAPGRTITVKTVGMDPEKCTGGRLPVGDHTVSLVLRAESDGHDVEFTATDFVIHLPISGPPTLVR